MTMKIKVNGIEIANILTNRSLTIEEAMYCAGYDINDPNDCMEGYEKGIEGFYLDEACGICAFDVDAAMMEY